MTDLIFDKLKEFIKTKLKYKGEDRELSSHWKRELDKKKDIESIYEHLGTGSFTKKSFKNFF